MKKLFFYIVLLFSAAGAGGLSAQLSVPGTPLSDLYPVNNPVDTIIAIIEPEEFPAEATRSVEDREGGVSAEVPIIGKSVKINRSVSECGSWLKLKNGNLVWRAVFTSPGAGAVGVLFSKFKLPKGAELYIYNEDKSQISGAFTGLNNNRYDLLNTAPVDGETVVVELNLFNPQSFDVELEIGEIVHYYPGGKMDATRADDASESCFVSVNCSPEGDGWQAVKRGVAQMYFLNNKAKGEWGYCSGTLVNNTRQDGTPYFLTAFHCGGATTDEDKAKSLFFFDLEKLDCADGDTTMQKARTLAGCELIASSQFDKGLDMLLLKISQNPPEEWNLYWNGWDFTKIASTSGAGIHHPVVSESNIRKSFKRISTYTTTLQTEKNPCATFSDNGYKCGLSYGYWVVRWAATENGHGVTAPGSSGSPLFNSKKRIIGTLTGGASSCPAPDAPDYYGRFDMQWNYYSDSQNQLKHWLDPIDISQGTLDGYGSAISTEEAVPGNNDTLLSWRKEGRAALFTWKGKEGALAEVFSTTGALVASKLFYGGENLWTLPAGAVYLVRVEGEIIKVQL